MVVLSNSHPAAGNPVVEVTVRTCVTSSTVPAVDETSVVAGLYWVPQSIVKSRTSRLFVVPSTVVPVMTAAASGIDAEVRATYGTGALVPRKTAEAQAQGRAGPAIRSTRQVQLLNTRERPIWVAFPGKPCPPQTAPATTWQSGRPPAR